MASTTEKIKSIRNNKLDIKEAKVIANYGDPGLDEDYHFDILSRFVIVMIESTDRVLTQDKWPAMLAVVKRPEHLWINVEGALTTPTEQLRSDAFGNINIGLSSSPSSSSIGKINNSYSLGEVLKIKKLAQPLTIENSSIFLSRDSVFASPNITYGAWHSEGSTLPYFAGNQDRILGIRQKTISPHPTLAGYYYCYLNKFQYEALLLNLNVGNTNLSSSLTRIFDGTWGGTTPVYSANGGYLFNNQRYALLSMVEYEDINISNKQRVVTNECIPLVVTTPNSFPMAKTRAAGTIAYNPSYAGIIQS